MTSIGVYAFYDTPWYNNQPDGVVYAGKVAYRYKGTMPANTSILLEGGTLGIADYAFSGSLNLTSITIPNSLTSIGDGAFSGCTAMTMLITRTHTPPTCGTQALDDINKETCKLIVPVGTQAAYQAADQWKEFVFIEEKTLLGDADNSGVVNINDVVCIINNILNKDNVTFIDEAADVDNNGTININDVVTLINKYILTNEEGVDGSKIVTIAEFNAAPESTSQWYQLTGVVKNLFNSDQYGVFDLEDASGSVYVYGLLSEKGGAKKQFQTLVAEKGIANGVTITIVGNRGSYNNKVEVLNAYFVKVEEGGGGQSGDHGTTKADPLSVDEAIAIINGLADNATTETEYFIKGKTTAEGSTFYFDSQYGHCNYYISDDGSDQNTIYVHNGKDLNNVNFTAAPSDWGKGTEVIIRGRLQKLVNTGTTTVTPEIALGNYVVSVTKATPTSNVTKSVDGTTLTLTFNDATVGSESIVCDFDAQGWESNTVAQLVTLGDGTTVSCEKGQGVSDPKFYAATHGVRLYAKNQIVITGYKKIAKIVIACDEYNGTQYVGNQQLYGTVSDKVFTVINEWTGTSGGTPLRAKTITIYYAQ